MSVSIVAVHAGWEFGINSSKHKQWKNRLGSVREGCYNNKASHIYVLLR